MVVENVEELFVVDVPQAAARLVLAQESEVGQELAEPHVGGKVAQLGQHGQGFACVGGIMVTRLRFCGRFDVLQKLRVSLPV